MPPFFVIPIFPTRLFWTLMQVTKLSQIIDREERVIAYASRTLSKIERRYCVTRKELLAVVQFIKHFRHFLYGSQFLIRTDHSSLQWLLRFKNPGQLAHWLEVISSYNMVIKHRPGVQHRNADALSRIPCHQCGFVENWETTPEVVKTINIYRTRRMMGLSLISESCKRKILTWKLYFNG